MQRSDNYARAEDVILNALKAFLPAENVSVSEYAGRERWMANDGGGYVGMWSHTEAPYLTAPMDSLPNTLYNTTALVGPGQCGKTETGQNWLQHSVGVDPANMLWYSATEFLIRSFVKTKINSMIEVNPVLRSVVGGGSSDNSLSFKRFGSMTVEFLPATNSTMISKSAPRIVADEYDTICEALGDVKPLLDVRRQTFGERSKLLCISHPDLAEGGRPEEWKRGVMSLFRDSTRKLWWWQCPECGAYSSPNPHASRTMVLHYDVDAPMDEIADMARLLCPVNGCLIEDNRRRGMNLTGKWVGQGETIDESGDVTGELVQRDIDGYWITGLMSPFILGGIGKLATARVQAERDYAASNDAKPLRQVLSKQWGVPMERRRDVTALDAGVIAERAESALTLGVVAAGVRFITVMIDAQINRFELLARGWCADGRSVVVDFRKFEASPGNNPADWDLVLEFATRHAWPLAGDETRGMKATVACFDSGGAPGVTLQGYEAWRRLKAKGGAKMLGKIEGRPVYAAIALKGGSSPQLPRLQIVFPDAQRKDRFAYVRGEIPPVGLFNPNLFKDDLNAQLLIADGGPWSVRFPLALCATAAPHPWFEQLVVEQRGATGKWKPAKDGKSNEATDLMVGTHVGATMLGINRIVWDRPPQWARPWDENVNVVLLSAAKGDEGVKTLVAAQGRSDRFEAGPVAGAVMHRAIKLVDRLPVRRA